MNITVNNVSLDKYLSKYKVRRLADLNDEDLLSLCRELGVQESWVMSKTVKDRRESLDRLRVVESIEANSTFDDYMGTMYWEPEHDKIDAQYGLREELGKHESGAQTFKTMENVKMGFYRLKPGEERELNVSKAWLEEYFLFSPMTTSKSGEDPKVMVYDIDKNVLNKSVSFTDTEVRVAPSVVEDLSKMSWAALKVMAKGYKIRTNGIKRETLEAQVKERLAVSIKI